MIPLDLSSDDDPAPVGGLWEFIQTNVGQTGDLTTEILDHGHECALPTIFSNQFEIGLAEAWPR